ncbi:FMN-binding domain-containing protein [Amycolatopsis sp. WAC 01375]|uniref:FMN-binding protein n=1 Tax=unclassified Amycolatopsis TaxID=2618356 RepID=UPI000F79DD22|nr:MULTISPECIES: FMN-binding protein [unclassified Amycolatopsis]RSM76408.1 FMN-binding domain-containing protein [Amycolatopsis sp. WAC 01375]RSN33372.1 FMN-binding domain-containing protein [Amycolatopsis sp. WAC 01416]
MKKTIVAATVALSAAGFLGVWLYEPGPLGSETVAVAAPAPTSSTSDGGASEGAERTIDGSVESNRYGTVQVRLVISAEDKISEVRLLQRPTSGRGVDAIPILQEETLTAQSADIDTVSGATSTSESYVKSLQAALDAR